MDNNENKTFLANNSKTIWPMVFAVNLLVIVLAIIISIDYFSRQMELRNQQEKDSFAFTVGTMEKVAYSYLESAQTYCANWASYISNSGMTIDEAVDFARGINTSEHVMSHIIMYDTLEGFSTEDGKGGGMCPVSYKNANSYIKNLITEIQTCKNKTHLHITRSYINPVNGILSMGFCHDMTILDESGNEVKAVLIRVVEAEELQRQWVFPTSFENARVSIIDRDGDFIIRGGSEVEGLNFYDIVRSGGSYNEQLAKDLQDLIDIGVNEDGSLTRVTDSGVEMFYSYHQVSFNDDWVFIGYIAVDDLNVTRVDLTIVIIAIMGFLIIIAVDGSCLIAMNKRLKASVEEVKKANEAKTRFLSSMSHDIRTPMNAIVGMTSIASRHLDDKDQVEECLRKISQASNHLLTLINDILDISKIESGKLSMSPIVFSIAESAGNLVNVVQPMIREKDIVFDVRVRKIIHEYIYADELRINQIFINILSNAVKYTPVGGSVKLDIEELPSAKDGCVRLIYTVSDTGIGMSEEFMKHMYTAFVREQNDKTNAIQGTGLGLAITKQMVDLLDGTIEVESKVNEGSVFKVTLDLPLAEKTEEPLKMPPVSILIADDDEMFLESAKDIMQLLGASPETVSSGEEAIKMVEKRRGENKDYACVIVDWKMPGMDGMETVKRIKQLKDANMPVVIISSYDWTDIEDEARSAGADGFINKPLFPSTAYKKLNDLLHFDEKVPASTEDNGEDLKGLNLLIAEDNDINWEIIEALLKFSGITSERAPNGQICVDMITNAPEGKYDAIFMDIQMPVMNGREAAKKIRASETEYVKNIPIIAMTADAFAEDIRSCLDVGMNGHVAKPLDMKKVFKELRKAINKS